MVHCTTGSTDPRAVSHLADTYNEDSDSFSATDNRPAAVKSRTRRREIEAKSVKPVDHQPASLHSSPLTVVHTLTPAFIVAGTVNRVANSIQGHIADWDSAYPCQRYEAYKHMCRRGYRIINYRGKPTIRELHKLFFWANQLVGHRQSCSQSRLDKFEHVTGHRLKQV